MELEIIFLNVLKYKDKQTGEFKSRFSYLLNDEKSRQDNDHLKGLSELSFYTDNTVIFDELQAEDALTSMTITVENRPSKLNPLKTVTEVTSIKTKHGVISLL